MSIPNYICELQDEIVRLRSEVSAQTAIAHEAQAKLRKTQEGRDEYEKAEAKLARVREHLEFSRRYAFGVDVIRSIEIALESSRGE